LWWQGSNSYVPNTFYTRVIAPQLAEREIAYSPHHGGS
jgi:hypothetical protein